MPGMRLRARMSPRDPDEAHRVVTPLELFFDLTFVVAVAQASTTLHHELVGGHAGEALLAFPIVFFGIWWAWMNFTWFASAYDTDDALYRLAVFVQMGGVLVLAAGIPRFLRELDPSIAVVGYVIMRVGLVAQWLRAAAANRPGRACALRYAVGISGCQVGWVVLATTARGGWWVAGALPLGVLELAVPAWAEREQRTSWHPGHIGERYGLFTIIVLGESVLSATVALQLALDAGGPLATLSRIAVGGILVVTAMWWIYFDMPVEQVLAHARQAFAEHQGAQSFVWGYGHFVVFAAAAATGAGLAVAVDQVTDHSRLGDLAAGLTLTVPVAIYLLAVWALHARYKEPGPWRAYAVPVAVLLILATSWTTEPVLATGVILAVLVTVAVVLREKRSTPTGAGP